MFRFLKGAGHGDGLNQMNEQFNDPLETYFSEQRGFKNLGLRALNIVIRNAFRIRNKFFGGRLLVNERIVEYPQILRWIEGEGPILDIGCVSSRLPIQLASLGYEVYGLDVRSYPLSHPNLVTETCDLLLWEPEKKFRTIVLISTIEHIGLGAYGDRVVPDADKKAIERISGWLAPGGQLLVSTPFGKPAVTKVHRIYDMERQESLFAGFDWLDRKYFRRVDDAWVPSDAEALADVASPEMPPNGVALLKLQIKSSEQKPDV